MLPTLFLSHGAPTLPLADSPASLFLRGLGATLERPKAILVASAHWETERPEVNAVAVNDTIHDFYGFPRALYEMTYPAPGDAALAQHALDLLLEAGLPGNVDTRRGLDHGAWVPLLLAWPEHDIPVVQVSIQSHLGPQHHEKLGAALAPLRDEGVLLIGSGSFTHDLGRFHGQAVDAPVQRDVTEFANWMDAAIREHRHDDLLAYRKRAPHAVQNHPTDEHLLPLYVAMGAAGPDARPERLHTSAQFSMLRMDAYAFSLMRLFVYGTLLDPTLVTRLTGQRAMMQPASLDGFRRVRLRGTPYPTLVPGRGQIDGALLLVDRRGLRRLHAYEGPRYRLRRVFPRIAGSKDPVAAHAWIAPGATRFPWP